jgi:L,D-transpeptidase ErfK/SrfK
MDLNGVKSANKLRIGDIKVVKGPFRVEIQLSKFNMDLYLQEQYVKSYKIGIGKPGEDTTTPTGKWRLKRTGKSDQGPTWYPDKGKPVLASDPEYPLGARWIPITCIKGAGEGRTGFALHGTKDPKSIGTRCSLGCIRLSNEDVIEVYKMLAAGISDVDIYK